MWKHMSSSCRRSVEEKLVAGEELCETFGLDGLRYPSFQCASGFSRRTSAADVVFACDSLLESRGAAAGAAFGSSASDGSSATRAISTGDDPDNENRDAGAVDEFGGGAGDGNEGVAAAAAAASSSSSSSSTSDSESRWLQAFWTAYETLPCKNSQALSRGLSRAMRLQKAATEKAVSMVQKREIKTLSHFRYVYLYCSHVRGSAVVGSGANGYHESTDELFSQPLGLGKLARFLVEMHKRNKKWAGPKSKPLVLLAERMERSEKQEDKATRGSGSGSGGGGSGTFFVLGVECPDEPGEAATSGSFLAKNFEFARRHAKLGSQSTTAMSFDGATMELRRDDAQHFLESLHSELLRGSNALHQTSDARLIHFLLRGHLRPSGLQSRFELVDFGVFIREAFL